MTPNELRQKAVSEAATTQPTMTPEDLRLEALAQMVQGVRSVLSGQTERYQSTAVSAADVIAFLESEGGEDLNEHDSNGWQWDAWFFVRCQGTEYVVGAKGYYGGVYIEQREPW